MPRAVRDVKAFYEAYDTHRGDRDRLFGATAEAVTATTVLYPGSYVDVAPSFHFDDVTYVDTDRRARQFFAHEEDVRALIHEHRRGSGAFRLAFHGADYREPLPIAAAGIDLLVSLYAGFVAEHCSRYVRPGGWLLANNSHGDASMASLDSGWELAAVVTTRGGGYRVSDRGLAAYLQPKRNVDITAALLHQRGRGIAYTKSPFAYLFRRGAA